EVVTNGVDLAGFRPREKDPELTAHFGLTGQFVAGYVGTHGMAHALETILDAADRIRKMNGGNVFRFILLGNGARKQVLVKKAAEMGLTNVIFIDTVPKAQVARYWSLLDVSIIHLKKTELFTTVIPSKLFECMGMGIPVLHGVAGESATIVEKEAVGLIFEPENADNLCEKLITLKRDSDFYRRLRQNCLSAAHRYDRTVLAGKMLAVLVETTTCRK
ncbi:MAG: glycosyltransferase WbuB, partial [Syntrophus sp. (in: bacteria)]|nr:glycosyltransferase WbuB [Syntrophus sp. (in: bacteria)]